MSGGGDKEGGGQGLVAKGEMKPRSTMYSAAASTLFPSTAVEDRTLAFDVDKDLGGALSFEVGNGGLSSVEGLVGNMLLMSLLCIEDF